MIFLVSLTILFSVINIILFILLSLTLLIGPLCYICGGQSSKSEFHIFLP